jgi:hypothetical protein
MVGSAMSVSVDGMKRNKTLIPVTMARVVTFGTLALFAGCPSQLTSNS